MKRKIISSLLFTSIIAVVLTTGCKKEAITQPQNLTQAGTSNYEPEYGKFKKEIIVTDESGKNSVFLSICSDDMSAIDEYIARSDLKLLVNQDQLLETIKQNAAVRKERTKEGRNPEINKEHSVTIEVVNQNLGKDVTSYSLEVHFKKVISPKGFQANDFYPGTYFDYKSESDFAGIVHWGTTAYYNGGYNIQAEGTYKWHWYSSWQQAWYRELDAANTGTSYYGYVNAASSYKTGIGVYIDARTSEQNYTISWSTNDFRSHTCAAGWFDGQNCGFGAAPSGTSAFIWGNAFYYTPVSGATTPATKCPMTGSSFDGANCYVMAIPSGADPFIWANSWYIRTNKIFP